MVAEVGQFALIVGVLLAVVAATAAVTVVLVRRNDARRSMAREPRTPAGFLDLRTLGVLAIVLVAGFGIAAVALHFRTDPPAVATANLPSGHPTVDPAGVIPGLEARLRTAPDDAEGWRMLAWSYLQVGRNAEAATAYGKAATLDPHNAEYRSAEGEATVLAADGQVTPAAEAAFRKAISLDPQDPRARYYLAMIKDQHGDQKGAMDDWIAILTSAPANAPWAPQVRAFVEKVAADRHIDLSGRLPPAAQVAAAVPPLAAPGPTSEEVAAAGRMSDGDRQAMIAGMVARLSDRLKQNPRDLDGWQRLMRAQMVLNQPEAAAQAYRDGRRAFAGSPADQASLRRSAAGLGIPGV